MFGNFEEIQKNLQAKLESISVEHDAGDGMVKITGTAAKSINGISINLELLNKERAEELEDLLIVAVNNFIIEADAKAAAETQNLMTGFLPPDLDLGGLLGK